MLQRLPIELAHVIYFLYRAKEITKKVCNNIMNSNCVDDLDRLKTFSVKSYDYDFNPDLNPRYVPMDGLLIINIGHWQIFTFLTTQLSEY